MGFGKKDWSKIVELEKTVNRLFMGVFSIEGNRINIQSTLWSVPSKEIYVVKISFDLNGKTVEIDQEIPMTHVEGPQDIVSCVREKVIREISNLITREFCLDNHRVLFNSSQEVYV